MSLKTGDIIPHFILKDQHGNDFDIAKLVGKTPFVLYFYPKDHTPGCTAEACSFRDSYEDFKDLGAEVIGISSDSEDSHRKFVSEHRLPFTLLSDPEQKVSKLFGIKNYMFGLIPGRETYVFDKEGKVMMVFNSVKASGHIEKALSVLKASGS